MTWSEFEDSKPAGMTHEEYMKRLPRKVLFAFALHMRTYRSDHAEYGHIYVLLDEQVPETPVKEY
jgi:hypothetical protein